MFLSYENSSYLGFNSKTKQHKWRYKIIDSEFVDVIITDAEGSFVGISIAVIEAYEKRNLPVASNLIRSLIWQNKKDHWGMRQLIEWNKQFNPKFPKYEQDVSKYLILL